MTDDPHATLGNLCFGFMASRAVMAATQLNIPDRLVAGPMHCRELAHAVAADPIALRRLMRMLTAFGVFAETPVDTYGLTEVSKLLVAGTPGSMRAAALLMATPSHWLPWGRLDEAVRQGTSAAEQALGTDVFGYLADHPEQSALFDAAMSELSIAASEAIVKAYDFRPFDRIVDVGGGRGVLLDAVLRASTAHGVLYDLPHVVDAARGRFEHLGDRVEIVGGSFFDAVPTGGDAYLLKHVLHDWDDARCVLVLTNVARAMRPGGRALVCEVLMPSEPCEHPAFILDVSMLAVSPGGRERTEQQFAQLFDAAGLKLGAITPTQDLVNVIEAVRA